MHVLGCHCIPGTGGDGDAGNARTYGSAKERKCPLGKRHATLSIRVCRVKFGAFYEYLDREHRHQFDRVASGHYARVLRDASTPREQSSWASAEAGRGAVVTRLALTADAVKDQTYFLAQLTQVKAGFQCCSASTLLLYHDFSAASSP